MCACVRACASALLCVCVCVCERETGGEEGGGGGDVCACNCTYNCRWMDSCLCTFPVSLHACLTLYLYTVVSTQYIQHRSSMALVHMNEQTYNSE